MKRIVEAFLTLVFGTCSVLGIATTVYYLNAGEVYPLLLSAGITAFSQSVYFGRTFN